MNYSHQGFVILGLAVFQIYNRLVVHDKSGTTGDSLVDRSVGTIGKEAASVFR
ncbi:MAG: hypothetical protein KUF77_07120 [Candidatus Thiodiazotropha sp. (ex Lucina aurantia)]|nr:hypothetical protein [Candidatus Thiodiazotropha sp. (ex Lucina aurantia)]